MSFPRAFLLTALVAVLLTLVMAWPVVRHPASMIYGTEVLGRDLSPYHVIEQFGTADAAPVPAQPLTDAVGAWLAGVLSPVAAYNLLVLASFPLAAMSAFALAWYLMRSWIGAMVAALAYAFAPVHLAHAAYHPHITQVQWLPLSVLALVALIDRQTVARTLGLAAALTLVMLTSFDAGLIALTIAPAVLACFWAIRSDADRNIRPFLAASGLLLLIGGAGALATRAWLPDLVGGPEARLGEIAFFRARWWAYLTPAIDHPWLGGVARRVFSAGDINLQLTEMQLYLGYGLLLLALIALALAILEWKQEPRWRFVPAAIVTGVAAMLISLGPTSGACAPASTAPACLIFNVAPMFRAYARFGIVAQLMLALAAGAGASLLLATPVRRRLGTVLLAIAVFEYWPLPARAHDVLPTTAHRWLADSPDEGRVLDCYPGSANQRAIPALMQRDVVFLGPSFISCSDPQLGLKIAGAGVSRVLVRRSDAAEKLPVPLPPGITPMRAFADADLYAVAQTLPPIVTTNTAGFFGHEHDGDDWWQWMSPAGRWTIRNTTTETRTASLAINLVSIGVARQVTVTLDDGAPTVVRVGLAGQDVTLGPWTLAPGEHTLRFAADGEPVRPSDANGSSDRRALTVAFRQERWQTP